MSSTNRNFIIAYILLVGLPLAGLAGVLKAGRHIAAPISIDGVWKIEANANRPATQACDAAVSSLLNSSLVISQSGKSLLLTFNTVARNTVIGTLDGRTINATLGSLGCGSDQPVALLASVDPKSEPRTLTGSLQVANCSSCIPVEFRAVRQPRGQSGGMH